MNDNYPNLENMDNRWVGKGIGLFSGINISYSNKYLNFSIEPYYYFNQNKYLRNKYRVSPYGNDHPNIFNVLNDNRIHNDESFKIYDIRQSKLIFNIREFGFGLSNENMWWGPGIHTSLTMTNNTSGFPYLMIGTLNEKRSKNIGFNFRYIFTKIKQISDKPYYTSLVMTSSFYTNPIITLGFSRNYISGGYQVDRPLTAWDAALLPFEGLFIESKPNNEYGPHDPWDQSLSGFLVLHYFDSGLKIFIELGTDDHRQNWMDLRSQPDHNAATIIGLRKYGLFNNKSLFGGFEYANIKQTYSQVYRGGGLWWWKDYYDYSSYEGRRWAAHSGSDSDDMYIFFGFKKNKMVLIPSINYERHGIVSASIPEVKIEIRLDFRIIYKNYNVNFYYEKELINNNEFEFNKKEMSNVFWVGISRELGKIFSVRGN